MKHLKIYIKNIVFHIANLITGITLIKCIIKTPISMIGTQTIIFQVVIPSQHANPQSKQLLTHSPLQSLPTHPNHFPKGGVQIHIFCFPSIWGSYPNRSGFCFAFIYNFSLTWTFNSRKKLQFQGFLPPPPPTLHRLYKYWHTSNCQYPCV